MKRVVMGPPLSRIVDDLKTLKSRWKKAKQPAMPLINPEVHLLTLLPNRELGEAMVQKYLDTYEVYYRILHVPSFVKEYQKFWDAPSEARPAFVAIVLLAISCVQCITLPDQPTYAGESSSPRAIAERSIEACQKWLNEQSQKHVEFTHYQIHCLLLLSRQINSVKKKRLWTTAGSLMRLAMSAGMHREPSLLNRWKGGKTSDFDWEMRRRIWATMVELELQASITRGLPALTAGLPYDVRPPLNVNDEELSESMQTLPTPKAETEFTDMSFITIAQRSLHLRVSLNSIINNPETTLSYDEVLLYCEQINRELDRIPGWHEHKRFETARALLDIQLRQFLVMLHGPFLQDKSSSSRRGYSLMVAVDAATNILDQHAHIMKSTGNYAFAILRDDVCRAVLDFSHVALAASLNRSELLCGDYTIYHY
jgi:hypothetical protein